MCRRWLWYIELALVIGSESSYEKKIRLLFSAHESLRLVHFIARLSTKSVEMNLADQNRMQDIFVNNIELRIVCVDLVSVDG